MINIISTQASIKAVSGPNKVYTNLIKGLDKLGYPYVINHDLNATQRLWVHDNKEALFEMPRSRAFKVFGPNLFVMPADIPDGINFTGGLYLHPSEWTIPLWKSKGFTACPIVPWPVGIDTDEFHPSDIPLSDRRVMVYHKDRDAQELVLILETLHTLKLPYWLVLYGHYDEDEYRTLLSKSSFVIWHGCHESQGIALQEAMSCNLPILVCDVTYLSQARASTVVFSKELDPFTVTAAPYFDKSCGLKTTDLGVLHTSILQMLSSINDFSPRSFVLQNLSLEGQARAFVKIWGYWGLDFEQGFKENLTNSSKFYIPRYRKYLRKIGAKFKNAR